MPRIVQSGTSASSLSLSRLSPRVQCSDSLTTFCLTINEILQISLAAAHRVQNQSGVVNEALGVVSLSLSLPPLPRRPCPPASREVDACEYLSRVSLALNKSNTAARATILKYPVFLFCFNLCVYGWMGVLGNKLLSGEKERTPACCDMFTEHTTAVHEYSYIMPSNTLHCIALPYTTIAYTTLRYEATELSAMQCNTLKNNLKKKTLFHTMTKTTRGLRIIYISFSNNRRGRKKTRGGGVAETTFQTDVFCTKWRMAGCFNSLRSLPGRSGLSNIGPRRGAGDV